MITGFVAMLAACGGSPGKIVGPRADVSFVRDKDLVYFYSGGAVASIRMDGSEYRRLFAAEYSLNDMTSDGTLFVLGDKHTNLYVGDERGTVRRVTAVGKRAGIVALSADGKTIASTRHSDFDLPQSAWTDSDAVYLIDTETLAHRIIPRHTKQIVTHLSWSKDGKQLWLEGHSNKQRIDVRTGVRTVGTETSTRALHARPNWNRPQECTKNRSRLVVTGYRGDKGLALETATINKRVVSVTGRQRGFHDLQHTLHNPFFSRSCDYALFEFRGRLWVVELATNKVGPLIRGFGAFLGPEMKSSGRLR